MPRGDLLVAAAVIALGSACLQSDVVMCGDGRICPSGTVCDDLHDQCVLPDQLTVCTGSADGEGCDIAGEPVGVCRDEVCVHHRCGDDFISGAEQCEGDDLGGATCTDLDFYDGPGLACTSGCTFDTSACTGFCGDGLVSAPDEACDGLPPITGCAGLGFDIGAIGCSGFCALDFGGCRRFGWVADDPPTGVRFAGLWGSPSGILFAAGEGQVWRNGGTWSSMQVPDGTLDLRAVWGTADDNLYAVGEAGQILRGDGFSWTAMASGTTTNLWDVWGSGPDDVYAIGGDQILRYDGSAWSAAYTASGNLVSLWGSGPDDVFVAGTDVDGAPAMWHRDAGGWAPMTLPPGTPPIGDLWGSGPGDVYVSCETGVLRHDGGVWSALPTGITDWPGALWGTGPDDLWDVTPNHTFHYDGARWRELDTPLSSTYAIWGPRRGTIVAAGYGGSVARHGETASLLAPSGTSNVYDISGTSPDDVFAIPLGSPDVIHWDGSAWAPMTTGSLYDLSGVWAVAPDDVYAVAPANVHHYDGSSWSSTAIGNGAYLYDVWAADATHVFAVGDFPPTILFSNGNTWSAMDIGSADGLYQVWGTGPTDVYALGEQILHYDGVAWSQLDIGSPFAPNAVGGTGPDDVYMAGEGVIYHYNGVAWSVMLSELDASFYDVWATGVGNEVFVAGSMLLHGNGTDFLPLDPGPLPYVNTVWSSGDTVFVGGGSDQVVRLVRTHLACGGTEVGCNDYWDDDCDGMVDACDPDCAGNVPSEQCADLRDDDCDGAADCADTECALFPGCTP